MACIMSLLDGISISCRQAMNGDIFKLGRMTTIRTLYNTKKTQHATIDDMTKV